MLSSALSTSPHAWLAVYGLLLFLAVFVGAVLWIFRSRAGGLYEKLERLPLGPGDEEGQDQGQGGCCQAGQH